MDMSQEKPLPFLWNQSKCVYCAFYFLALVLLFNSILNVENLFVNMVC